MTVTDRTPGRTVPGPRAAQIERILAQRAPALERVREAERRLRELETAIRHLDEERRRLVARTDGLPAAEALREIDPGALLVDLAAELAELTRLKARFARRTLNIGVVGHARQGKSRLLQSLTGLTDQEIPAGSQSHCTGVRSTIFHLDGIEPYAEIVFHTEASFLQDVVALYYRELGLGPAPHRIEEFAARPLPKPSATAGTTRTTGTAGEDLLAQARYEHLRQLHGSLPRYRDRIGSGTLRIPPDRIREFVAQDTAEGVRSHFAYLAVREAKIYCPFPARDLGRLAVIDLPGLGNTAVGDQQRMLDTLGRDTDVMVMVKLPQATGSYWSQDDIRLLDTVTHGAAAELKTADWAFLVLNHLRGTSEFTGNGPNCRQVAEEVRNGAPAFVDILTADCSDAEEAGRAVLSPLLDHLDRSLTVLDRTYVTACERRLDALRDQVAALVGRCRGALGPAHADTQEVHFFQRDFPQRWEALTLALEKLLKRTGTLRSSPHQELASEVKACLAAAKADPGFPTAAEIEQAEALRKSWAVAFYDALHPVRTRLARHFDSLNRPLQVSLDGIRTEIAEHLRQAGGLDKVAEGEGRDFLVALTAQLPENSRVLRPALDALVNAEPVLRGFLRHRIRPALEELQPNSVGPFTFPDRLGAAGVLELLRVQHESALAGIREGLEESLVEINQVIAFAVDEFVDYVLRAPGARTEWENLFLENRALIWAESYQAFGERSRLRAAWESAVARVQSAGASRIALTG